MSNTTTLPRRYYDPERDRCPRCGGGLRYGTLETANLGVTSGHYRNVEAFVCADLNCVGTVRRDRP